MSMAASVAALLALTCAGLATADPVQDPGDELDADTAYTPVPSPTGAKELGWRQVGGAVFESARAQAKDMGYVDTGAIPHTVDFFTVSFSTSDRGLAAGAKCDKPVPDDDQKDAALKTCTRVPVMYEYSRPSPSQSATWKEVALPDGQTKGFVGAVAWVSPSKAVAVGGTGCYPRREVVPDPNNQAASEACDNALADRDPGRNEQLAGDARAWVLENGTWRSISDTLPPTMTGLTALAFSPRADDCKDATSECGLAGGLGQLWTWKDGSFLETGDMNRESEYLTGVAAEPPGQEASTSGQDPADKIPPFRVRSIAFNPAGKGGSAGGVVAGTSGCCWEVPATDPATNLPHPAAGFRDPRVNYPRVLTFNLSTRKWTSQPVLKPIVPLGPAAPTPPRTRALPDSIYAVGYPVGCTTHANVIVTTGSPTPRDTAPSPTDPFSSVPAASRVINRCDPFLGGAHTIDDSEAASGSGGSLSEEIASYPEMSSVRLTSGDDAGADHASNLGQRIYPAATKPNSGLSGDRVDGYLDWAVGEWAKNGRGVAYTTTAKTWGLNAPYPLDCPPQPPVEGTGDLRLSAGCKPNPQFADELASDHLFLLPSYPLNAFDTIGATGTSWAAGDRGALLSLGSGDAVTSGAAAGDRPKLGSGEPTRLSSREAYDAFRPSLSDEVGMVPQLATQPTVPAPGGRRLASWGSSNLEPDDAIGDESVDAVAMSRDGSEGWALGPHRNNVVTRRGSLHHFDGSRWTRCDAAGIPGVLSADPACAELRELTTRGQWDAVFLALARVPTEKGEGGADDTGFEAVAIAKHRAGAREYVMLRFADGKWTIQREWTNQVNAAELEGSTLVELAFAAPGDGWLVANTAGSHPPHILRLTKDGAQGDEGGEGRWIDCDDQTRRTQCFDSETSVLPATSLDFANPSQTVRGTRLTSVGSRVYLYGTREQAPPDALVLPGGATPTPSTNYPFVLSIDTRAGETEWRQEYDPVRTCATPCPEEQGVLNSLSVARPPGGSPKDDTGWGAGAFGGQAGAPTTSGAGPVTNDGVTPLLRLVDPAGRRWAREEDPDPAAEEYLLPATADQNSSQALAEVVAMPGAEGSGSAVATRITKAGVGTKPHRPMVWLNPASGRWEAFSTPFSMSRGTTGDFLMQASVSALAPDGRGGLWLAVSSSDGGGPLFYRFGDRLTKPVFDEVPHPVREVITSSAAGGDGSFWVATESGTLYRHDRMTGWDRVSLKGWDVGGVVQSPAYALSVGRDGQGIAVGKNGRIAEIGPRAVGLEPSAVLCSADAGSCATTRTLHSVAVASDGSALAGGDNRALIWRPPGGRFRAISQPDASATAAIVGISMPAPNRAWIVTNIGDVFAGTLSGGAWSWAREAIDGDGKSLARNATNPDQVLRLRAVAIGESGRGYAVGDDGLLLERTGDGANWRRVSGYLADLRSVTLGPGERGALIGGAGGLILTKVGDRFEVSRHDDYYDPLVLGTGPQTLGAVVGLGMSPGAKAGQVEAWAVTQANVTTTGGRRPPPGAVLHYSSDPDDPLLSAGQGRARPLPDAPAPVDGELTLAAFGKSECQAGGLGTGICTEPTGTGLANDVILRAVRDAIVTGDRKPDLALFTGDANDVGGSREDDAVSSPTSPSIVHERWWELVGGPLDRAGVPLYGALGGQDLSNTRACDPLFHRNCAGSNATRQKAGANLAWRQALASAPKPWGGNGSDYPRSANGLSFEEFTPKVDNGEAEAPVGGARTHYAVDVKRGDNPNPVLRLVVVDTSLKTLSGTGALQNPVRDQLAWLEQVLTEDRDPSKLPAVVVSETPSYAYDSRAGATTDTLADSAAFEAVLVKNQVTAVVSGRLGWNGLYWVVAPGLHAPCPGGSYQPDPPRDATQLCQGSGGAPTDAGDRLAGQLEGGLGAPVPKPSSTFQKVSGQVADPIPVAIAASAGGKFGPNGEGSGSGAQGFWRGYTRIRVLPPEKKLPPVIEQRPVFDWIGIQGNEHTLTPGRRLNLNGYGREPLGLDVPARYVDISGPAITHRYDLVLADPDKPYMPKVDPTNENKPHHYVPVPDAIGASIDPDTGVVRYNGRGNHPPVYALAILSVDDKVATWPIVFAPRRSFKAAVPPRGQNIVLPPPARPLGTPVASLPPTPPANVPQPPNLQLTFPPTPTLPNLQLNSPQTQPPPPPAPPPPPVSPTASALQISPNPAGLNVAPAATVIPPPAPPIQPAPPGGARREARQRQAAAAKSEEGADQSQESTSGSGENTQASTRYEEPREMAFTAHTDRTQPSAWARGLLYGGGLGLGALTLALGYSLMRPGPRRRAPELPAPAWARANRRRD